MRPSARVRLHPWQVGALMKTSRRVQTVRFPVETLGVNDR
jgi:hypothetical protein